MPRLDVYRIARVSSVAHGWLDAGISHGSVSGVCLRSHGSSFALASVGLDAMAFNVDDDVQWSADVLVVRLCSFLPMCAFVCARARVCSEERREHFFRTGTDIYRLGGAPQEPTRLRALGATGCLRTSTSLRRLSSCPQSPSCSRP